MSSLSFAFALVHWGTPSFAEPWLLTVREGLVQRNTSSCSREMFDYVIRSKRVGVRAEPCFPEKEIQDC